MSDAEKSPNEKDDKHGYFSWIVRIKNVVTNVLHFLVSKCWTVQYQEVYVYWMFWREQSFCGFTKQIAFPLLDERLIHRHEMKWLPLIFIVLFKFDISAQD